MTKIDERLTTLKGILEVPRFYSAGTKCWCSGPIFRT